MSVVKELGKIISDFFNGDTAISNLRAETSESRHEKEEELYILNGLCFGTPFRLVVTLYPADSKGFYSCRWVMQVDNEGREWFVFPALNFRLNPDVSIAPLTKTVSASLRELQKKIQQTRHSHVKWFREYWSKTGFAVADQVIQALNLDVPKRPQIDINEARGNASTVTLTYVNVITDDYIWFQWNSRDPKERVQKSTDWGNNSLLSMEVQKNGQTEEIRIRFPWRSEPKPSALAGKILNALKRFPNQGSKFPIKRLSARYLRGKTTPL